MNFDNVTAEKMRKATEDLKQMQENFKKYGVYVLNTDIPEATTRQELYSKLEIENVYEDIAEKQKEFQKEINRISKDKRYKEEFKSDYKKKMQEEFQKYKTEKLAEVQSKLQGYKEDLQNKYSYKVDDPQLEATQTNNALLQLAMLDTIENNTELIQQFINQNWNRKSVMNIIEAKYSDNPHVASQIANKRNEEAKPYQLVNICINDVNTFLNNKDYTVNADYIENGITKFNSFDEVTK